MITTGLKKLDEFLNGGIPYGKSLLFSIEPGMEETDIAFQIMKENIKKMLPVYVSSKSSPKNIIRKMNEFNVSEEEVILVDGYSSLIGAPSDSEYMVEEPHDIESYEDTIMEILYSQDKNVMIVFDSLSNIMDLCNERMALEGIERINREVEKKNGITLYNFILWPYKEGILYRIRRMFNAIIEARKEKSLPLMEIKKIDWDGRKGKFYFKIFKPDGLRIYIPKIIVVGSFRAGKTTFLRSIAKNFFPVERQGVTTGVEYAVTDYKGYRADIFGIPGREGFEPLMEKMLGSSMGAIIIVDSSDMESIKSAPKFIEKFRNMPYIVVANKQDLANAVEVDKIKEMIGTPNVVGASALNGEGTYEAFEILAEKIMEELNAG